MIIMVFQHTHNSKVRVCAGWTVLMASCTWVSHATENCCMLGICPINLGPPFPSITLGREDYWQSIKEGISQHGHVGPMDVLRGLFPENAQRYQGLRYYL